METLLVWDPSLSVGNAELDEHHKQLLALNQRAAELLNDKAGNHIRREFRHLLNEIVDLAEVHFAAEERILALNGCPNLAEHKVEHYQFIELLAELIYQSMLKELKNKRIARLLSDYIEHHFRETDMACREYMRERAA